MKKIYLGILCVFMGYTFMTAQQPANDIQYAFGKKIFGFFKDKNADMIVSAIDPKLDENTKQQITTSILDVMEKIKLLDASGQISLLNVLYAPKPEKMLLPVLTGKKEIVMMILDKVVEHNGNLFLDGPIFMVHSIKEKNLTEGRKDYMFKCFSCHGQFAEGTVGPNLTDDYWKYAQTNQDIRDIIANGRKGTVMIPFKDYLSSEEIDNIMLYLSILQGQRMRKGKPAEGNEVKLLRDFYLQ